MIKVHVENQFSKATFAAGTSKEDEIDIDDPDFGAKQLGWRCQGYLSN